MIFRPTDRSTVLGDHEKASALDGPETQVTEASCDNTQAFARLRSSAAEQQQSGGRTQEAEVLRDLKAPDTTPDFRRAGSNNGQASTSGRLPQTVQELQDIIASNCPVFYFHPEER